MSETQLVLFAGLERGGSVENDDPEYVWLGSRAEPGSRR